MKAVSKDEVRKLDEWAIKDLGIPRLLLMENAGRGVAHNLALEVPNLKNVCVVAGRGGNGGDGIVSARHLAGGGVHVQIFLLSKKSDITAESRVNLDIAEKIGIPVIEIVDDQALQKLESALPSCDAVVDAILGIGFSGTVGGVIAKAIDLINNKGKSTVNGKPYYIISVDIPSGLDADNGSVSDHCVRANSTVTFTFPKLGMLSYPAVDHVGKLTIVDIGVPRNTPSISREGPPTRGALPFDIITSDIVAAKMPPRKSSSNKGDSGEVLLLASSRGMTGAAVLAAKAALRVGAGLVRVGVPETLAPHINSQCAELITIALPETKDGTLSEGALDKIIPFYQKADVVAVGPGISTDPGTAKLVKNLLRSIGKSEKKLPVVIDADALNAISDDPSIIGEARSTVVLTPHPGEMSRLTKMSVDEIQKNRLKIAKEFASKYGAVLVLKGARTVVSGPSGDVLVNITGNPAMASAGMGDVLTGTISGLIAQGISAWDAALSGVYLHGLAGDVVASLKGDRGILATDLIEALPYVIRSVIR